MKQVHATDSLLTFEHAIRIAFEKNFDILIAENEADVLRILNRPGQAGMLPDLYLNAGISRSQNSTKQEYSSGERVERPDAVTDNMNAGILLDWTIFDGMKMFYTKQKLAELSELGQISLKIEMENVYLKIAEVYFGIVRQQQILKSIREEMALINERLIIAERRLNNGSGNRLDYLHARTEVNAKMSEEKSQLSLLEIYKTELNRLLSGAIGNSFSVSDSIIIDYSLQPEQFLNKLPEQNTLRSYHLQSVKVSESFLKESRSFRLPRINLQGGYTYSNTENDAGFIRLNRLNGFNYGLSATMPVFTGFRINDGIRKAKIELQNTRLRLQQTEESITSSLLIATRNFQDQKEILQLEEENIISSREILQISQERFKSGVSTIIELKEVQRSHEEAISRLMNARYETKMAEINLKKITGSLITIP